MTNLFPIIQPEAETPVQAQLPLCREVAWDFARGVPVYAGGRPVEIELSREETFAFTRVRHAIDFSLKTAVRPDGRLVARRYEAYSNQGGYASHGHSIAANA